MGQKVNPISNRLGIVRGWDSNWFGGKNFGDNIVEDQKIRKYLNEHPADFDPRQYLKPARNNLKELVKHKLIHVLGCDGKAD